MPTPQPSAQQHIATKIIMAELIAGLDSTGIRLIGPNEPAPEQDQDDDEATIHDRWCKIEWPKLHDSTTGSRTADCRPLTLTASVGVGNAAIDSDEYQLAKDLDTVVDLLRGLHGTDPATGHELDIQHASGEQIPGVGLHPRSNIAVVTSRGEITRLSV